MIPHAGSLQAIPQALLEKRQHVLTQLLADGRLVINDFFVDNL